MKNPTLRARRRIAVYGWAAYAALATSMTVLLVAAACSDLTPSITPTSVPPVALPQPPPSPVPAPEPTAVPPAPTPTPEPTATPTPPPAPLTAQASILENNSLIARIEGEVESEGLVYVEYWAEGVARLRSKTVPTDGDSYVLHAVRLRKMTEYSFQVFGTDGHGQVTGGPTGTFRTGALPEVLQKARFEVISGKPSQDLTFMEFGRSDGLLAIDGEGNIVWYYISPDENQHPNAMTQRANGNIVYIAVHIPATSYGLVEITPLGEEVARLVGECPPDGPIHHEVYSLPDGRVMYLSKYIVRPGYGDPPAPQEADTIGIWDSRTGENQIVWNVADFIPLTNRTEPSSSFTLEGHYLWGGCSRDTAVQDWSHGTSTSMTEDGSVLVSLRNLNQVVSVAPDFQSVQWRLGGPESDFTFPDPNNRFYHQHSAVALANGNVLLFDNGNYRPAEEGGQYSRALELELDFENMTARKVWEFRHEPDIFSGCCSNVHRLNNGNTLMVFGTNSVKLCCRPFNIVEADPAGNVVWEVVHYHPGKAVLFRVSPADSIMGERLVSEE